MTEQIEQLTRRIFMTLGGAAALGAGLPALGTSVDAQSLPKMSEQDRKNVETVLAMSAAWKTGDINKVASYMTDDVWFRGSAENVAAPGTKTKKAFIEQSGKFQAGTKIEMVVTDAFALHPMVITAHHQLFDNKERGLHEDLYIGCFFMQNGLIREWNDYGIIPYGQPRAKDTASRGSFIHIGGTAVKRRA
jgi:hypothetical protein